MSSHQHRISIPTAGHSQLRMLDQYLETNGLGGYSSSTVGGVRLWPSQGMVVVAKRPPIDRYVLINGFDVSVEVAGKVIHLSTNRLKGDQFEPDGRKRILQFKATPWPQWTFDLDMGRTMTFECFTRHGTNQFVFAWQLQVSPGPVILRVRPLLSGRPINSTRTESLKMSLMPDCPTPRQYVWNLRAGAPPLSILSDGGFLEKPRWVHGLLYDNHSTEDLACPGEFEWELAPRQRAHLIAGTADEMSENPRTSNEVAHLGDKLRNAERTRRRLFRSELDRAADQYIVQGSDGRTVISGYPRGTEMGARAMIAIRGISLSPGRLDVASSVLRTWRERIAAGMLPSEISEHRLNASFSSPEPSLWYVVAAYEYLRAGYRQDRILPDQEREDIIESIDQILQGMTQRIQPDAYMDEDGLLAERHVIPDEPYRGQTIKRVHVQALWITALRIGNLLRGNWDSTYQAAKGEFDRAFWDEEKGYLDKEIIQTPNEPVERVSTLSLEQVLAVGGLPLVCVDQGKASLIVHALEQALAQPEMIKSAISFPWLFGPFIEAWYRVRYTEHDALEEVMKRFVAPWKNHLEFGGLNHLSETPATARGKTPSHVRQTSFGAIETSELLRILHLPDLQRNADPFDDRLSDALFH